MEYIMEETHYVRYTYEITEETAKQIKENELRWISDLVQNTKCDMPIWFNNLYVNFWKSFNFDLLKLFLKYLNNDMDADTLRKEALLFKDENEKEGKYNLVQSIADSIRSFLQDAALVNEEIIDTQYEGDRIDFDEEEEEE